LPIIAWSLSVDIPSAAEILISANFRPLLGTPLPPLPLRRGRVIGDQQDVRLSKMENSSQDKKE
jgi:hypothetical protein